MIDDVIDPPTGVVTFLFTDIVDSTGLLHRSGDAATAVFAAHDRMMRGAARAHRGYEVRVEGDSFFFAFERASDAVAAAIAMHRSLDGYPWPPGGRVCVRIGMHTGEADVHGRGYVGLAVHRAARIAGQAAPGETLMSTTTANVVGDRPYPGIDVVDRGWRTLRGFSDQERLFALERRSLVIAAR